jgi:hypothetical protein
MTKRGVHDMGGDAAGPIDRHEHEPSLAERRIDAMMLLMRDQKRHLWLTDENRRTIESMAPGDYEAAGYYARWLHALRGLLVEKGVLTEAEIEERLASVRARYETPAPDTKA